MVHGYHLLSHNQLPAVLEHAGCPGGQCFGFFCRAGMNQDAVPLEPDGCSGPARQVDGGHARLAYRECWRHLNR